MGQISLPYGRSLMSCPVAEERKVTVLRPKEIALIPGCSQESIIREALIKPVGSPPLAELARGKKRVVVVTSDHTRPVPSHLILPLMCEEIRKNSPAAEITILVAVGSHRATTPSEMADKFGEDFVVRETIINHDPADQANLIFLGKLPSGGDLIINRLAGEADLLVADGFIEPHQFAGFSGGRKSILPGIASMASVLASHNAEFTTHPRARPGVLEGNPFQIDMVQAARMAKLAFIVNVILNSEKEVVAALAGDFEKAHLAGCEQVRRQSGVLAVPAPIVISSNGGYPLDQNIYQSTKSIMAADLTCEPGGVIIAVNECGDGHGGEAFYRCFKEASSIEAMLKDISQRSREETRPEQWAPQLVAHILLRHKVFFVSTAPAEMVRNFGMTPVAHMAEALVLADRHLGRTNAAVTVLPEALGLIIQ